MDFRDRDGGPLITWHDAESAFEAWKRGSKGRPCDYSAMTYARLREGTGIQWPCTDDTPDGGDRLYRDARTNETSRKMARAAMTTPAGGAWRTS